ncbi:hypothetical protein Sjap_023531 [Stephania japonica]|uniref:Uncharacterized protein n=1 Tax=Stephania japonica TaxID=461633 RepID=A0AAP0EK93_9MAGN
MELVSELLSDCDMEDRIFGRLKKHLEGATEDGELPLVQAPDLVNDVKLPHQKEFDFDHSRHLHAMEAEVPKT